MHADPTCSTGLVLLGCEPSILMLVLLLGAGAFIISRIANRGHRQGRRGGAPFAFKVLGVVAIMFLLYFWAGFWAGKSRQVQQVVDIPPGGWTAYPPLVDLRTGDPARNVRPPNGFPPVDPDNLWALRGTRPKNNAAHAAAEAEGTASEDHGVHDAESPPAAAVPAEAPPAEAAQPQSEHAAGVPAAAPDPSAAAAREVEAVAMTTTAGAKPAEPKPVPRDARPSQSQPDPRGGLHGDTYVTEIVVGPYATLYECDEALPAELNKAVRSYVNIYLGQGASDLFTVPPAFIHDHIIRSKRTETTSSSVGPMQNLHVTLAYDSRVRGQLHRWWRDAQIEGRLREVAVGAGGLLVVLATLLGYLRLDTLSRGYYTGRLRLAAAGVILGVVFVAVRFLR